MENKFRGTAEFLIFFAIALLPFSKSAANVSGVLAAIFFLLCVTFYKKPIFIFDLTFFAYALFLGVVFLSFFNTPAFLENTAWLGVRKWLKWLIFFLVTRHLLQREKAEKAGFLFVIALCVVSVDGFYQYLAGADLFKNYAPNADGRFVRMTAAFKSPNDLAAFFLLGIPMAAWLYLENKKKWIWGLAFAFFVAGFILTFSRGAVLGLLTATLFYGVVTRRWKWLGILGGIFILCALLITPLRQVFISSLNPANETISERWQTWKFVWSLIWEKPWLGHGVNQYMSIVSERTPASLKWIGYAHNGFLQIWFELGLIGLTLFLIPLTKFINDMRHFHKQPFSFSHALWIGLVAFLLQSCVDTNLHALQTAVLFWFFWGIYSAQKFRS